MIGFEEGYRGVSFEEVGVGVNLDEDVGAGRERVGGFDVAAAGAKVADLGAGAGVDVDVEDFGGGGEGKALGAATFVLEHGRSQSGGGRIDRSAGSARSGARKKYYWGERGRGLGVHSETRYSIAESDQVVRGPREM